MMKRRTAREKAIQALFQIDLGEAEVDEAIDHVLYEDAPDDFLNKIVHGTIGHQEEIDQLIREHLEKWTIDRIGNVDRQILRLAVFEMVHMEEIDPSITMNEAIELAKKFGDDDSSKFINAVLSKIKTTLEK